VLVHGYDERMKLMNPLVPALLVSAIALTACASNGAPVATSVQPTSISTGADEKVVDAPVETTPISTADASVLGANLKAAIPSIKDVLTVTEDNDPNDLIGRPGGYVSAAVIYDENAECDEPSSACGGTIEVFATEEDAQKRVDYIQSVQEQMPIVGTEYQYLTGSALLRLSSDLKPSLAAEYEALWK